MKCNEINYLTYSNKAGKIHKQVLDISEDAIVTYEITYKAGRRVTIGKQAECGIQTFASWADHEVKA